VRALPRHLGVTRMMVRRVWQRYDVQEEEKRNDKRTITSAMEPPPCSPLRHPKRKSNWQLSSRQGVRQFLKQLEREMPMDQAKCVMFGALVTLLARGWLSLTVRHNYGANGMLCS
jgi:hypothetical protein